MGNRKNPRPQKKVRQADDPADRTVRNADGKTLENDHLAEIKRKINEGFYATHDFSERLAAILIGKSEIWGGPGDDGDNEIGGGNLAAEI